ncbi:MAG: ComEC/Rec2 family competence protein [Candidatus Pacebacteria bacterium]|nr:ComEC/Rec2 family competence protein [Candidatus Paceibacterota bacterium]
MIKDFELSIMIAGFILAIFISSFFKLGFSFFLFLSLMSIAFFIYQKYLCNDFASGNKILILSLFIFSFALGILRYEIKDSYILDSNLENNLNKKLTVEGIIFDEPIVKEIGSILIVDFKNIIFASSSVSVSGRGIIKTDTYPEFKYGDLVKVTGELEKPENYLGSDDSASTTDPSQIKTQFEPSEIGNAFHGSGGTSFDYVSYLGKDDIFYKIDFAKTEFVSAGHGNFIKTFLFKIKNSFIRNINKVISEPQSSLLSGILLGSKSSLDEKTSETFRIAGLSHLIALSGYNITIVSEAIMKMFYFLPRNYGLSFGVFGVILFVLMSGSSSTAVRAGIMSLVVILANVTRRKYQVTRALIFAALLMIIINPKILVFDISFQLSFLATVAIIYVSPILKEKFHFVTERFKLRETVSSTISAQILVLPLIIYKMGLISFVTLPVNVLVLTLIPTLMLLGFFTGIFGYIWIVLSIPFAWVTWFLLSYIIKVSELFAGLPFSHVEIKFFPVIFLVVSYIIIIFWIMYERQVEVSRLEVIENKK